ncbi:hypothetical protein [Brumimicrobium sp.]|uniref:hypothetical protein n=1 Tax=Brumimicrobium sp. TaxID=2029867 RepID=UPI003A8F5053
MPHSFQLEIKTFTISEGLRRGTLSAREISQQIFGINEDKINNSSFIESFSHFIQSGFNSNKAEDGFITNEDLTKKYKIVEVKNNLDYSSFFCV